MKLFSRERRSWQAEMSLYDDLGVGASDTKTEGWSKNFKLLQSQLKVKKAALTQAKVNALHACSTRTRNINVLQTRSPNKRKSRLNCTPWAPLFLFVFINYSQHIPSVYGHVLVSIKLSCCSVTVVLFSFFFLIVNLRFWQLTKVNCQNLKLYWPQFSQFSSFLNYPWLDTSCVHLAEDEFKKNKLLLTLFCHCV